MYCIDTILCKAEEGGFGECIALECILLMGKNRIVLGI